MNNHISQNMNSIELDIFNAVVGFEDNQALTKKQLRSKRMGHARRAIEKRRENKQLNDYVNDSWSLEN